MVKQKYLNGLRKIPDYKLSTNIFPELKSESVVTTPLPIVKSRHMKEMESYISLLLS